MLILSGRDLESLLSMREVIEAVEGGFRALASGTARMPPRLHLEVPEQRAVLLEMPSYLSASNQRGAALGTKIVSVFEGNPGRGLEAVQAVYLLLDSENGLPLALMDGRFITAIRTAAASAVATKYLAPPGPKALAVFGAGTQARFHVEAMCEVCDIESVAISSRTPGNALLLAEEMHQKFGVPCAAASSPEQAVSNANLICACTSSTVPLFEGSLIRPGTHVNAVGAFTPSTRELDTEAVRRSRVFVDAAGAAGTEAGEILIPLAEGAIRAGHVRGELSELVSGAVAGREKNEDVTLFKSCGVAIEDLVTARAAYEKASETGAGIEVDL